MPIFEWSRGQGLTGRVYTRKFSSRFDRCWRSIRNDPPAYGQRYDQLCGEEYYLKSLCLDRACVSTSSIIARHLDMVGVRWLARNRFPLSYDRKENFNNGYYASIHDVFLFVRLIRNSPICSPINECFNERKIEIIL